MFGKSSVRRDDGAGSDEPVLRVCGCRREAESQDPENKSQKPEAKSQKTEAKGQRPEAKSEKPEAKSEKAEAKSQKAEAKGQKVEDSKAVTSARCGLGYPGSARALRISGRAFGCYLPVDAAGNSYLTCTLPIAPTCCETFFGSQSVQ